MKSMKAVLIAVGLMLACGPAWSQTAAPASAPARGPQPNWWSQAGGENGPARLVWAARKNPETPYKAPNKPIWHIADVRTSHNGLARWEQEVLLTRDFDGRYVQMAPGDKRKCMFWADDRAWGWVYSGQVKVTIDGQEPKVLPKGWVFNVAPRAVKTGLHTADFRADDSAAMFTNYAVSPRRKRVVCMAIDWNANPLLAG